MELCCNSLLHQRCVGQAGRGASGQERAPGGATGLASCLLPLPAPCSGEVRVLCCSSQIHTVSMGPSPSPGFVHPQWVAVPISPDMLGCSQGEVERAMLMSGAPRGASLCSAPAFCPAALLWGGGRAHGHLLWPCLCPPSHTPKRGSLSEKEVCPMPFLRLQQSHFLRCGRPESPILVLAARVNWAHGETSEGWDPLCAALQIWKGKGWIWGW